MSVIGLPPADVLFQLGNFSALEQHYRRSILSDGWVCVSTPGYNAVVLVCHCAGIAFGSLFGIDLPGIESGDEIAFIVFVECGQNDQFA